MSRAVLSNRLVDALKAEGFPLPDECREARVVMGVGSALMIQYDVFLAPEALGQLGRALARVSDDLKDGK